MKLNINKRIFSQAVLDSGEITPMTGVMHRFVEPGTYHVSVFQGDIVTSMFPLVVDEDAPQMLNRIDLVTANCSCAVNPKIHTVFHAPKATRGYSVLVEKFEGTNRVKVFDNKELQDGDQFFAVLLRPGEYQASNGQGAKGRISVTPHKTGKMLFTVASRRGVSRPNTKSVQIECNPTGFNPEAVTVQTAQPIIFTIKTPSRVRIRYQTAGNQEAQTSS